MMCGASKFGRWGKRIANRQSGRFLAGAVGRNCSNGAGFTLIELLVVVAIIALLMAILLPALQLVERHAQVIVCQSNLNQWGKTLAMYTDDSQGRLPPHEIGAIWLLRGSAPCEDDRLKSVLYNNVRTEGIACCPVAVKPIDAEGGRFLNNPSAPPWQVRIRWGSTFRAWQIVEPGPPFLCSYGFNGWLINRPFDFKSRQEQFKRHLPNPPGLDVLSLRKRGEIPALLDSASPCDGPRSNDEPPRTQRHGGNDMKRFCKNRHDGYVNGLFLDWSVRKIGLKELWTLKWHAQMNTAGSWTRAGGVQPEDWPEWMRNFRDY